MSNPIRSLLGLESRSAGISHSDLWSRGFLSSTRGTAAGKSVTVNSALGNSTVYACIRTISDDIAGSPIQTFQKGEGTRKDFPTPKWLEFSGYDSRMDVIGQTMVSLLTDGNAFLATYRGPTGEVLRLEVLDPRAVEPYVGDGGVPYYVISTPKGQNTVSALDILHIRGFTLPGKTRGLSPIANCRETIGLSLAAQEFGASFFGNGALPGLVVEADGTISPAGIDAMKAAWNEVHQGAGNAHRLAVFTEGAKLSKITVSPEDAQFLQTRGFQVNDAARIYGVPVNLLQHSDGPEMGASIEDKGTHYVQHTLKPWAERVESAFSWLMWSEGLPPTAFAKLNLDSIMRGNIASRFTTYSLAVTQGILTINEVRAMEDRAPVPWGDTPISVQVQEEEVDGDGGGEGEGSSAPDDLAATETLQERNMTEAIIALQKVYLAVDKVVTAEEARAMVSTFGFELPGGLPEPEPEPELTPVQPTPEPEGAEDEETPNDEV